MDNIKRQRFVKVAEARVSKLLDMLRLLKNCSNRNNYEYTEEDIDFMFSEISKAVKETKDSFTNEMAKSKTKKFSFNRNEIY